MSHGHGHAAGEGAAPESVAAGYELKDAQARPLVISTIAVFVLLGLSFALVAGLVLIAGGTPEDTTHTLADQPVQLPPEPRLEQNPNVDGDRIVSEAVEQLEGYGWVQQRDGIAHIPIERSLELLVEKGISPFGAGQ